MTEIAGHLAQGWVVLGVHLWQTTLILLVVFVVARRMRAAPARLLHLLWSVAFAKILLPTALFGGLVRSASVILPDRLLGVAVASSVATLETIRAVLDPSSILTLDPSGSQTWSSWLFIVLTLLWGVGVLRALIALAREHRATRAHKGVSATALPPAQRVLLVRVLEGTSIPLDCVLVTDESVPPYVAGLLRPRIFVSRYLLETLSTVEMRAILLHEESHRRRRDPLQNAIQHLCSSFLFFYPLIGILLRRLQQATELICDEWVVRSGVGTETYTRALARTLRFGLAQAPRPLAAGVGGGSLLRLRFERLTHPGRFSVMHGHRIILFLVVLLIAVATFLPQPLIGERTDEELDIERLPTIIDSTLVRPIYPEQERESGVEGTVILGVKVTADGEPDSIEIATAIEGHPAFSEAAIEAIRQWRFEPGEVDGEPVACKVKIPIKFALE